MNIEHYSKCFSEDELCEGAELILSGEAKAAAEPLTEKAYSAMTAVYGKRAGRGTLSRSGDNRFCRLSVSVPVRNRTCKASLCFDRQNEIVLSASCSCPAFLKDHYGCAHLAAALTGFYLQEEGEDFFRGSRIEERLKSMAGTDDPFTPGVMKRTDVRLRNYLEGMQRENRLPIWPDEKKEEAQPLPRIYLSCSVLDLGDIRFLELKAGIQRAYIIKDIPSFLDICLSGGLYSFGKQDCVLSEENFRKDSLALLRYIIHLYQTPGHASKYFVSMGGSRDRRYLKLRDRDMAAFLELSDGAEISFSDGNNIPVRLDRKGLNITLRKKSCGAVVKVSPASVICQSTDSLYLQDTEGIFRIKVSGDKGQLVSDLVSVSKEAYIRETDMPAFISGILPILEEAGNISMKGIRPDSYQKEDPEFLLYLDLEGQDTLTCQPFSEYADPPARYPLFDSQTGNRQRNGSSETAFANQLTDLFDTYLKGTGMLYAVRNEDDLFRFLQKTVPVLQEISTVYISDRLKRIKVKKLPQVQLEVIRNSSSLLMNINAGSLSSSQMHEILSAYSLKKKYTRLKDGSFFDFEDADPVVWDTLSDLYTHYGKKDPKLISVPLYRALYLDEMLAGRRDLVLNGDEYYKQLLRSVREDNNTVSAIPESLKGVLRPYQENGFSWICRLKKMGFGGILADDMGLGKTLQVLAFLLSENASSAAPSLIVCPASLVYNWKKELERFTPELSCTLIVGTQAERSRKIQENLHTDVWITSYDLLKRDIAYFDEITFSHEIIDEAQYIKNQNTQAAKSVRGIHADFRLALTGTPIENRLSELWSIMDYLMPGFLYPYARFQKEFEIPVTLNKDTQCLEKLRHMTHPFILRRLKTDVLKELPEKQEETVSIRLEGEQQKLYEAYAAKLKQSIERTSIQDFGTSKIQILAEITRLRELCCDPSLVVEGYQGGSAKLDACLELIRQAVESGHKLLLFSQFTAMLDIICSNLNAEGFSYYRIDGSTSKEKRMEMVDNFAGDDVPVFCISLKAGGTGLNLTAADIVIHYDPWWNQAAQNQATDRAHRIGQTSKVTVYELVAKNTLEERIQEIKAEKTKLMTDVLSGEAISSSDFNRNELLELL